MVREATIRAQDLDQLAAKLGRPTTDLSALQALTPDQLGVLSDAIDAACKRQGRLLDDAMRDALPALPRRLLIDLLRGRTR